MSQEKLDLLTVVMQMVSLGQSSSDVAQQSTGTKSIASFVTVRSDQDKNTVRQCVMGEAILLL